MQLLKINRRNEIKITMYFFIFLIFVKNHCSQFFTSNINYGDSFSIYYVQTKNDGQLVLKRSDHLYPYPPFEASGGDPVLCNNLKSLSFKYFDTDGSESDEWDSDSDEYGFATPAAISIQLEIGDEATSYKFETMVRLAVQRQKIE